ncbi:MAG: hypothetical protein JWM11_4881 [Planctomycetaceae bacterium]|nr:hypothetical protein [Planctomycetaceae bacterium]
MFPPPKATRCSNGDWDKAEKILGFNFPDDYKEFISAYGSGSLQSFLHIWNYLDSPSDADVTSAIPKIESEYQYDKDHGYQIDFVPYPQPGCFIPFCSTDDGNYLNWRTLGKPNQWPVVAYDSASGQLVCAEGVNMVHCILLLVKKQNPFGDKFCNVDIFRALVVYKPLE